jgi:hypothetical protein
VDAKTKQMLRRIVYLQLEILALMREVESLIPKTPGNGLLGRIVRLMDEVGEMEKALLPPR